MPLVGTHGGTRTHTEEILSLLPLPIGLRGQKESAVDSYGMVQRRENHLTADETTQLPSALMGAANAQADLPKP